jgi:hypothetical protein
VYCYVCKMQGFVLYCVGRVWVQVPCVRGVCHVRVPDVSFASVSHSTANSAVLATFTHTLSHRLRRVWRVSATTIAALT